MTPRKRRQRDRRKAAGCDCPPPNSGGKGEGSSPPLRADWQIGVPESVSLIREAVKEGWPTECGPQILAELLGGREELGIGDVLRICRLLLHVEKQNRRERGQGPPARHG